MELNLAVHKEQRELTFLITKAMKPEWMLVLSQSDLQGFTCPWNGLNASRNAHHPKEMFLVNTKDSFEALELNSGIWTCLSRTCAQNSTATSGTLS